MITRSGCTSYIVHIQVDDHTIGLHFIHRPSCTRCGIDSGVVLNMVFKKHFCPHVSHSPRIRRVSRSFPMSCPTAVMSLPSWAIWCTVAIDARRRTRWDETLVDRSWCSIVDDRRPRWDETLVDRSRCLHETLVDRRRCLHETLSDRSRCLRVDSSFFRDSGLPPRCALPVVLDEAFDVIDLT